MPQKMDIKKELRDQTLHFITGAGSTLILSLLLPVWAAALLVAAFAYGQEVVQRISSGLPWYSCGTDCMLDLIFCAVGIVAAVLIEIFLL
ncbi:hypothetical protein [Nitrosomonas sp. Nm166]|uniref:hypothetical protein n=1 Tax=Nitrosomonas sp. Nm166 TaxID=1881054 RepID=UPI0008ED6840|nr:hypothetical protein [Nitrosomonas sp. Nm166]SFF29911.1 hypothetical protein SAMN05428977_11161 [Nitrosomonas sp. Nm166]